MKIALLADIHGNLRAFQAVVEHVERWKPDQVVVIGDTINRGPLSLECWRALDKIRKESEKQTWQLVRGNHEDYVLASHEPDYEIDSPEYEVFQGAHWVYGQLRPDEREAVAELPLTVEIAGPQKTRIVATHGSLLGNNDGIFPWIRGRELRTKVDANATVFAVAHTHFPLFRRVDETLVVNVGAVGLPFDGDPRACYVQLEWLSGEWKPRLVRLHYDRERARSDFESSGYLDAGGPLAQLVLDELDSAESRLFPWMEQYFERVVGGQLSVQEAVERFRAEHPRSGSSEARQ